MYANILHTFTFYTFLISLPYCRSKCSMYPFNLFLKGDISSYSSLFLGHHQIWQPEKRADRHTDVTDILYLLKVVLLHGQQVTPGDIIFLCMCVCGKPKTETFTKSKLHNLKQMYLHNTFPYSNRKPPAAVKAGPHKSDRA